MLPTNLWYQQLLSPYFFPFCLSSRLKFSRQYNAIRNGNVVFLEKKNHNHDIYAMYRGVIILFGL